MEDKNALCLQVLQGARFCGFAVLQAWRFCRISDPAPCRMAAYCVCLPFLLFSRILSICFNSSSELCFLIAAMAALIS